MSVACLRQEDPAVTTRAHGLQGLAETNRRFDSTLTTGALPGALKIGFAGKGVYLPRGKIPKKFRPTHHFPQNGLQWAALYAPWPSAARQLGMTFKKYLGAGKESNQHSTQRENQEVLAGHTRNTATHQGHMPSHGAVPCGV